MRFDRQQRVVDRAESRTRDDDGWKIEAGHQIGHRTAMSLTGTSTPPAPSTIQARRSRRVVECIFERRQFDHDRRRAGQPDGATPAGGSRTPTVSNSSAVQRASAATVAVSSSCSMPVWMGFQYRTGTAARNSMHQRRRDDRLADAGVGAGYEQTALHAEARTISRKTRARAAANRSMASSSRPALIEMRSRAVPSGTLGGRIARTSKPSR